MHRHEITQRLLMDIDEDNIETSTTDIKHNIEKVASHLQESKNRIIFYPTIMINELKEEQALTSNEAKFEEIKYYLENYSYKNKSKLKSILSAI